MRLTDIFHQLDLSIFPIVGLVAFFAAFVIIVIRAMRLPKDTMRTDAMIPLSDDVLTGPNARKEARHG